MIVLPYDASDEAILALVERWVDALATRDYAGAAAMLTQDGNERDWPPSLVDEVISGYEAPGGPSPSRVTPRAAARQELTTGPSVEVTRWVRPRARPEVAGTVEYDLPLNGTWSDLTAIFWIRRLPQGLALELYDIHIL